MTLESFIETYGYLALHQTALILGFRFLYGLRTITPFALGMSRVRRGYFFLLNTLSALVWAAAMGTGGYLFGNFLRVIVIDIKQYGIKVFWVLAIIGGLIWGIYFYRCKRTTKKTIPALKSLFVELDHRLFHVGHGIDDQFDQAAIVDAAAFLDVVKS